MVILSYLRHKQNNLCCYCKCELTNIKESPDHATIEHLKDKWDSINHIKSEDISNLAAACYKCNNTRGSIRNKIARNYYQELLNSKKINLRAASISSAKLLEMFGPVPTHLFQIDYV